MTKADVQAYLDTLQGEQRQIVDAVREVIRANLAPEFEEGIQYGMLGYFLPHSVYPDGYHANPKEPLPFTGVGAQKHHVGLYLFCVYTDADVLEWFTRSWRESGMRLDMGKACVRVRKLDEVQLDVIGALFARVSADAFVASYERARPAKTRRRKEGRS